MSAAIDVQECNRARSVYRAGFGTNTSSLLVVSPCAAGGLATAKPPAAHGDTTEAHFVLSSSIPADIFQVAPLQLSPCFNGSFPMPYSWLQTVLLHMARGRRHSGRRRLELVRLEERTVPAFL